jgi:hypothetical protein
MRCLTCPHHGALITLQAMIAKTNAHGSHSCCHVRYDADSRAQPGMGTSANSTMRFGVWPNPTHLSLKVLRVKLPGTRRQTGVVTLKNRTLSPLAKRFIEVAKPLADVKWWDL